jgi:hypothetical protein
MEEVKDKYKELRKQQKYALHELRKSSPSLLRNSVLMFVVQIGSGVGTLACVVLTVGVSFNLIQGFDHKYIYVIFAGIFLLMRLLNHTARMVRVRNKYILSLEELIEK